MQESHLKKIEKTEILGTLKSFFVGDSEFISFADSRVAYDTWRVRYMKLKKAGILSGTFRFLRSRDGERVGTWIMRTA